MTVTKKDFYVNMDAPDINAEIERVTSLYVASWNDAWLILTAMQQRIMNLVAIVKAYEKKGGVDADTIRTSIEVLHMSLMDAKLKYMCEEDEEAARD